MIRRLVWAAALVLLATGAWDLDARSQPAAGLLVEPPAGPAPPFADQFARAGTVQARAVVVNAAALDLDALDVAVLPDTTLRALVDSRTAGFGGAQVWSGRVEGAPLSTATFVRTGDIVQGSIRTLEAAYSIEPLPGSTLHVIRQVDLDALGPELPPRAPAVTPAADVNGPADVIAEDDGSTFDVLVVYTAAARAAAGGTDAALVARINLGITDTNTAYANSGVIPRLRLVGTQLVTYTESGNLGNDLDAVTLTSDGQMDTVHALRNSVGADLVKLVVGSAAGGACGVAWLMESLTPSFASHAFSVTAYECISPNYTFGHELGHNMGSNHAPEDPVTPTPLYAYSFGYKHPGSQFRTLMAYNCGGGCPRILHFSNPSVSYNSAPTGTVSQHNNATSINNARNTIANWRAAAGPNTAPTISAIASQTINEDTPTSSLPFTVGDAQTAASSLTVSASSSNPALVTNSPAALALGGSGANRTLVVTPVSNAYGSSTITVTVSDGSLTATSSFLLTVNAVNDVPVSTPTPASASTPTGVAAAISVVVSDVDSAGSSLSLTATSSNPVILPLSNIVISLVSTAASSRTFQVTMTPAAGQQGPVTVTLYASDGVATGTVPFVLTVTPPASPTITPIAPQTINEDAATQALAFTIGDVDTPIGNLTVSAASSNTALVPNTGGALALGGSGANRTLTVTPLPDQNGNSTITLNVSDGGRTTAMSFVITVLAVNDPPSVAPVPAQTTDEDMPVTVAFTVSDIDTPLANLNVQAVSMTPGLVPPGGLVTSGTGSTRTVTITPAANQHGSGTITLIVHDGGLSVSTSFPLTVTPVNDPPAVVSVPPLVSTTMGGTTSFTATVADIDTAGEALTLQVTSSNPALLPESGIVVAPQSFNAASRTFLVTLTPVPGETGTTMLGLVGLDPVPSSPASVVFNVTATPEPPHAPTALAASASGTSVSLGWTPALTGAAPASFVVEIGTAPGATALPTQSVSWPLTALVLTLPEGTYYLRVRAVNEAGTSNPSPEVSVTVVEPDPIPGPPAGFSAITSGRSVRFSWAASAVGAAATTFVIEAGSTPGLADIATINTGSAATVFDVANVPPGTYWVRARAANAAGVSAPTQDVSIVMGGASGCVGLPARPVLLPPVVSGNMITLSWNPPSAGGAPTGYVLMAGTTPGLSNLAVVSTGGTGTSFAASAPDGLYFVRIAASNACGVGTASNEVRFHLGPQPPDAPTGLTFTVAAGGQVNLTWVAPASGAPVTGYMIEAGSSSGLANLAALSTGSTVPSFAAVAPGGTYFVRVRALNGVGAGDASNEVVIVVP